MSQAAQDQTSRQKVLLCEDEFIVALDIKLLLEDFGFEVIGPFADMKAAIEVIETEKPAIAVLDVNLRDGQVFPLADTLAEAGVHLIFHSGHADDLEISRRYPKAETCAKPIDTSRLKGALSMAAT